MANEIALTLSITLNGRLLFDAGAYKCNQTDMGNQRWWMSVGGGVTSPYFAGVDVGYLLMRNHGENPVSYGGYYVAEPNRILGVLRPNGGIGLIEMVSGRDIIFAAGVGLPSIVELIIITR